MWVWLKLSINALSGKMRRSLICVSRDRRVGLNSCFFPTLPTSSSVNQGCAFLEVRFPVYCALRILGNAHAIRRTPSSSLATSFHFFFSACLARAMLRGNKMAPQDRNLWERGCFTCNLYPKMTYLGQKVPSDVTLKGLWARFIMFLKTRLFYKNIAPW